MNVVKVISTRVDNLGRRLIKFLRNGFSDVQESRVAAPYGIDTNPIKDMVAIYSPTAVKGETVIIGYLNKNSLADIGEIRTFSTDSDGNEVFYTWLKNNGTLELGGNANNLARYQELETAFNQLKSDFNSFVTVYNSHVHTGVLTGGASSGTTPSVGSSSSADITGSKIEEIKCL